jgi:hypothetical protein
MTPMQYAAYACALAGQPAPKAAAAERRREVPVLVNGADRGFFLLLKGDRRVVPTIRARFAVFGPDNVFLNGVQLSVLLAKLQKPRQLSEVDVRLGRGSCVAGPVVATGGNGLSAADVRAGLAAGPEPPPPLPELEPVTPGDRRSYPGRWSETPSPPPMRPIRKPVGGDTGQMAPTGDRMPALEPFTPTGDSMPALEPFTPTGGELSARRPGSPPGLEPDSPVGSRERPAPVGDRRAGPCPYHGEDDVPALLVVQPGDGCRRGRAATPAPRCACWEGCRKYSGIVERYKRELDDQFPTGKCVILVVRDADLAQSGLDRHVDRVPPDRLADFCRRHMVYLTDPSSAAAYEELAAGKAPETARLRLRTLAGTNVVISKTGARTDVTSPVSAEVRGFCTDPDDPNVSVVHVSLPMIQVR